MFYHIANQKAYSATQIQKTFGIIGLTAKDCADHGFAVLGTDPRPSISTVQRADLSDLPAEVDGIWFYNWTVVNLPAEEVASTRMKAAAQECSRRIYAIADATSQMNMASMASAGLMSTDQLDAWKQALFWVGQMRGTWRGLAADVSKIISDDANWPTCPVAAAALADGF
jgi:hypothetical protein